MIILTTNDKTIKMIDGSVTRQNFIVDDVVQFTYKGETRTGKVVDVSRTTVTTMDELRKDYRQFRFDRINK